MDQNRQPARDVPPPESPRHGFHGDRGSGRPGPWAPRALTIALSREAGARGGTIGRRAGRKLGWQVYDQELLEHMAQEGPIHQNIVEQLAPEAVRWCEEHLERLLREGRISEQPTVRNLARLV